MDRRDFLALAGGAFAFGTAGCAGAGLFLRSEDDFDENLAVFLSDIHICGNDDLPRWHYTRRELAKRIAEILRMRPLPRHVVTFGDVAFDDGDPRDYALAREQFRLLEDAGIVVTHAVGNHDRRQAFLELLPMRAKSPVDGRVVSEVRLPTCDLILLDTLIEKEVGGELDDAQQEWLVDTLARRTRPVFVCAHHHHYELRVGGRALEVALTDGPTCVGWINGHGHTWVKDSLFSWGAADEDPIRALQLPSAGLWGDIGLVEFRAGETEAVATLRERGFWFNDELHPGEARPEVWRAVVEENEGQFCRFPFARAHRNGKPTSKEFWGQPQFDCA